MSQWICIKKAALDMTTSTTSTSSDEMETILTLPHPFSGIGVRFLLQRQNETKFSLLQIERVNPNGLYSWFVGQNVQRGEISIERVISDKLKRWKLIFNGSNGSAFSCFAFARQGMSRGIIITKA